MWVWVFALTGWFEGLDSNLCSIAYAKGVDMDAGTLKVKLVLDSSEFEAALDDAVERAAKAMRVKLAEALRSAADLSGYRSV